MADHVHDEGTTAGSSGASDVLANACRRVLRRLLEATESDGRGGPDPNLLHDAEGVRSAVHRVLEGEDARGTVAGLPSTAVPLVSFMRAELLKDREHDPVDVLEALRALERLDRAWRFGAGDDAEADLRAWLSRPDALELVVELAHDLRSPLTSIIFLSETIQKAPSGQFDEVQRRQLSLIYIAALGLSSVVSDVVELAVGERDLVDDQEATDFWVTEVVDGVARLVLPMSEEKGVDLLLEVAEDERWHGHPHALSRILLNLVTNALKFTETGFVEVGMKRLTPCRSEFWVRDTGRGIPEQQLAELFVPFRRRSRGRSHFFSASGLGLSICQRYLQAMGSELHVETKLGEGTRFYFQLDAPALR